MILDEGLAARLGVTNITLMVPNNGHEMALTGIPVRPNFPARETNAYTASTSLP